MKNLTLLAFPALLLTCGLTPAVSRADFVQTDLVSDIPSLAPQTDPDLKNPWGMSFGAKTPIWVSNQGSNTSTLYDPLAVPIKVNLTVDTPTGAGPPTGPTGQVFNSTASDFMIPAPSGTTVRAIFLFATLQGTIEGWNPGSNGGLLNAEIVASVPHGVLTGLTLDSVAGPTTCTLRMPPAVSGYLAAHSATSPTPHSLASSWIPTLLPASGPTISRTSAGIFS